MEWMEEVAEGAERLGNRALDSLTHSARELEKEYDSDHDGSLLDNILPDAVGKIPIVGDFIKPVGEELGDMATDIMGTRHEGLFDEESTFDAKTVTDQDYKDGHFDGLGQGINDEFGIGENSPADLLQGYGMMTGALGTLGIGYIAEELRGRDDPYAQAESGDSQGAYQSDSEYQPYQPEGAYQEQGDYQEGGYLPGLVGDYQEGGYSPEPAGEGLVGDFQESAYQEGYGDLQESDYQEGGYQPGLVDDYQEGGYQPDYGDFQESN